MSNPYNNRMFLPAPPQLSLNLIKFSSLCAEIAQLVEHINGYDEVTGSTPVLGSIKLRLWLRLTGFKQMYYVYILKSLGRPGAIYAGSTSNLRKRLAEHNSGKGVYTNKHKPWKLEMYIVFSDRKTAEDFEAYLKSNS